MLTPTEQIEQLKRIFSQMGSVVELLNLAGADDGPMDDNQTKAAAVCACIALDDIAMGVHFVTEQMEETTLPEAVSDTPETEAQQE
jgi:hypothetical protein